MGTFASDTPPALDVDLFQRALLATTESILIADNREDQRAIIFANPAFEQLTGYAPDEALGRDYRFLQGDETSPDAVQVMDDAVSTGHVHKTVLRNYRKDGSPFWNSVTLAPLRSATGFITHLVGVHTDVSEARAIEQERQRLQAEVERGQENQLASLRDILHSITEDRFHLCRTEADLPKKFPSVSDALSLSPADVRLLRHAVLQASDDIQMPPERSDDIIVAVGEAATNAVVHGGGGSGEVCSNGRVIQVWITDSGPGISLQMLHRAVLERGFSTGGTMGYGYWVIIRTCDEVWLKTDPSGTTLVLQQGMVAPAPLWLAQMKDNALEAFRADKVTPRW